MRNDFLNNIIFRFSNMKGSNQIKINLAEMDKVKDCKILGIQSEQSEIQIGDGINS